MESSSSWHYPNMKPNAFFFNYNFEPFPAGTDAGRMMMGGECDVIGGGEKKKRLTSEQLELLENSFQEEIKLDPDRKMRLSRDLRLHPRQVAVWFQNRRARWKAKQLERLYDSLKRDFDAVSREKHALENEVMKLRALLMEQATRTHNHKQVSIGCTENISGGDETVESTSPAAGAQQSGRISPVHSIGVECHYNMFTADDYNNTVASPPYWPTPLPSSNYPC